VLEISTGVEEQQRTISLVSQMRVCMCVCVCASVNVRVCGSAVQQNTDRCPIIRSGLSSDITHLVARGQIRRILMCECEVWEQSDLWQHWPNHIAFSITNDGTGSLSLSLALSNDFYFQMSTSKCVEKCQL